MPGWNIQIHSGLIKRRINTKTDIKDFINKFCENVGGVYKISFFHEKMIELLMESRDDKLTVGFSRNIYKEVIAKEIMQSHLINMKKNETFAIATPEGVHIFKKTDTKKYINKHKGSK
ncbi:MAG: hypothetical protein ACYDBX_03830 [Patescibacteria group bacterium]